MSVDGIIGRKVGMTQLYAPDGKALPVTVITAGPCVVETPYWSAIVPAGWTAESVGFGLRISR